MLKSLAFFLGRNVFVGTEQQDQCANEKNGTKKKCFFLKEIGKQRPGRSAKAEKQDDNEIPRRALSGGPVMIQPKAAEVLCGGAQVSGAHSGGVSIPF